MTRSFWLIAALLTLTCPATAQTVVVDQWLEEYLTYRKTGFAHVQLSQTATGFVQEYDEWTPTAAGMLHERTRIETDADGRIQRYENVERGPLGAIRKTATRTGAKTKWTMRVRQQPEKSGEISVDLHDPDVVAYLITKGKRPAGNVTIQTLDFPEGVEEKKYEVTWEKSHLRFGDDESLALLDKSGGLVHAIGLEVATEIVPVTEAQARDMTRTPAQAVTEPGVTANSVAWDGVRLRRPGKDWALVRYQPDGVDDEGRKQEGRFILLHPAYEVLLLAEPVAIPLPRDRQALERFVPQLEEGMNRSATLSYTNGRAVQDWGVAGIRFDLSGEFGGHLVSGSAWVVRRSADQAMLVLLAGPQDHVKRVASEMEAARKAISIGKGKAKPVSVKKVQLPRGLTIEVPSNWKRSQGTRPIWTSPTGGQLGGWVDRTGSLTPDKLLERWNDTAAQRFGTAPGQIQPYVLAGRPAFRAILSIEPQPGTTMKVHLITVAAGQGRTMRLIVANGPYDDPAMVDDLLRSARWR